MSQVLGSYPKQGMKFFVARVNLTEQAKLGDMRPVFLEYAWDMNGCDPCAADPLSPEELRKLGVFWLPETGASGRVRGPAPMDTFVTRLHVLDRRGGAALVVDRHDPADRFHVAFSQRREERPPDPS